MFLLGIQEEMKDKALSVAEPLCFEGLRVTLGKAVLWLAFCEECDAAGSD